MTSLVVERSVSSTGRVPCSGQALIAKVHGVAVIQQRLSYLEIKRQQSEIIVRKYEFHKGQTFAVPAALGMKPYSRDWINWKVKVQCGIWKMMRSVTMSPAVSLALSFTLTLVCWIIVFPIIYYRVLCPHA